MDTNPHLPAVPTTDVVDQPPELDRRAVDALRALVESFSTAANQVASGQPSVPAARALATALHDGAFPTSAEWRYLYYAVLAVHPHSDARWALARTGPLGVLRALVHDPDPHVRYAVLDNPYVVDAGIQAALAADPEEEIVLGLLERLSPTAEVCQIIKNGPHVAARRRLARMRVGVRWLHDLADDEDLTARCIARSRLDARGALGPGHGSSQ